MDLDGGDNFQLNEDFEDNQSLDLHYYNFSDTDTED